VVPDEDGSDKADSDGNVDRQEGPGDSRDVSFDNGSSLRLRNHGVNRSNGLTDDLKGNIGSACTKLLVEVNRLDLGSAPSLVFTSSI
jgi:hypothetical protein